MQPGNRRLPAGALAFLLATLAAVPAVSAQGKDELWEISTKMEMAGMPMAMPAQVNRVCVGKDRKDKDEHLVPRQSNCRMVDSKRSGSKYTYKMECTGNDPMTMIGEMTFGNNAYDGQMRMTMTKTNDTMNMAVSGRRVGDCTAPAR
ncbi:MAG: DUF3617 domain-containing protein [Betaproteobacteria bacterium]|jgi:hypothetical protein|nr:DUF3617 domain-containing protein [Betaproteobacteria bacterium]